MGIHFIIFKVQRYILYTYLNVYFECIQGNLAAWGMSNANNPITLMTG